MQISRYLAKYLMVVTFAGLLLAIVLLDSKSTALSSIAGETMKTRGATGEQPDIPLALAKTHSLNPDPPDGPARLVFIHHSCGDNWLRDSDGGLRQVLNGNNYYVLDVGPDGWGPPDEDVGSGAIGDHTDIGHWYNWFVGPHRDTYLSALYTTDNNAGYNSGVTDPGGENEVIMFKSCFPNSLLHGDPNEPPTSGENPLRGRPWDAQVGGEYVHTVGNAKGIYNDLLEYFRTRQDKLFVVITMPPHLCCLDKVANARALNNWLVDDWLDGYPYHNVAVFDFFNVLTTNGGDPDTNDYGWSTGNHHRVVTATTPITVEHITDGDDDGSPNTLEYPTQGGTNPHPSPAGNQKATGEFVPLLNVYYNCWKHGDCWPGELGPEVYLPIVVKQSTADLSGRVEPATAIHFSFGSPSSIVAFGGGANVLQQAHWPIAFDSVGVSVGTNISNTYALVDVDLDGDGDLDLVSGDYSGRIIAWQNDGTPFDGGWTGHQVSSSWSVISLAAGDLDSDGDTDLVSAQWHGPVVWENDGDPFDGGWASWQIGDRSVGTVELADINGDGRLDVITGVGMPWWRQPYDSNWITVWYAPAAPFGEAWSSTDVGLAYYTPMGLAVGDLDNDGDNDIVIGTAHAPPVGDVDNPIPREDWPDVYQVRAFRNDGGDHWTEFNVGRDPEIETLAFVGYHGFWGASVTHVALADLDHDGDTDIVATERVEGDFLVMGWQNDGTPFSGELWAPSAIAKGEEHYWLEDSVLWAESGDFDLDGDLDVVSGSRAGVEPWPLNLWENTGIAFGEVISETHWLRHNLSSRRKDIWAGRVADLDRDGDLDLATATHSQVDVEPSEVRVWENADFRMDVAPAKRIAAPGQAVTCTGAITGWRGFDHMVSLWVSGLPAGADAAWSRNPLAPPGSSVLTLTLPLDGPQRDYPLLAVAIGGHFIRTAPFTLTVTERGQEIYLPLVLRVL